jgi:CelD/BcsL family acetyltransferase involved in cellulose biosynthesis
MQATYPPLAAALSLPFVDTSLQRSPDVGNRNFSLIKQAFAMTMAAAIESRTAGVPARPKASRIARVDVVTDLGEAEPAWRALEDPEQFSTPYQRYDLIGQWQLRVGTRVNGTPLIVIAYDGERRPLVLMPLTLTREHGVRIARFMGGKHATFNMALWDRDFAREATASDLAELLSTLRARDVADLLVLTQQPRHWRDILNPFAMLPKQPSANDCPALSMVPGDPPQNRISNSFRRRLKSKERKLQSPGYRYHLAASEADVDRILDWFFRVKPMRMAEQKLPNVFAEPGVEEFIRSACRAPHAGGGRVIDLHALECDDEVIAMFAGVADGHRFSMMFNTYTMSARSRYSPGLILMRNIIDHYAGKQYRGRPAATAMSALNRLKRQVKRNPMLLRFAQTLRRAIG